MMGKYALVLSGISHLVSVTCCYFVKRCFEKWSWEIPV